MLNKHFTAHILRPFIICSFLLLSAIQGYSQLKIEPSEWWVGMQNEELLLLVYGEGIKSADVKLKYNGVELTEIIRPESENYLLLDLKINSSAKSGSFPIEFKWKGKKEKFDFVLNDRNSPIRKRGISDSDIIYLITPDRFANGNTKNDVFADMHEDTLDRNGPFKRHGGDLQGIIDHLDYIEKLGVSAVWLNPVLENNEHLESYHGYAITDFYQVDKRFGTNELYKSLIDQCHKKEIKMIKDVVFNHFGDKHPLTIDPPFKNWIHEWKEYTSSNFRAPVLMDKYAADADKKKFSDGWFDHHMPDMNQQDPLLARYLIQNSIWWIEKFDIDAFRIDTYAYPDQKFMADWGKAILSQYPDFSLFAETWVHGKTVQGWFVNNTEMNKDYNNYMPAVTDFQLYYALNKTMYEKFGWTEGIASVYYTMVGDYIYPNPEKNVTFLDNHDLARFSGVINKNIDKYKIGLGMLLTLRGIPCIYYGTEIMMAETENHGLIREDFSGGWREDKINKFERSQLDSLESIAFDYTTRLTNWRNTNTAAQSGKFKHFVPEKGVYVYFRYNETSTVMIVVNTSDESQTFEKGRYDEMLQSFQSGLNIIDQTEVQLENITELKPWSIQILELK